MKKAIIKRQARGYVKRDGMHPGGEWFSITSLCRKYIPMESVITDKVLAAWMSDHYGPQIFVEAYTTFGYDKSTNYAGCEMDEYLDPEDFYKVLGDYYDYDIPDDVLRDIQARLDEIASDTDGYEPYEID